MELLIGDHCRFFGFKWLFVCFLSWSLIGPLMVLCFRWYFHQIQLLFLMIFWGLSKILIFRWFSLFPQYSQQKCINVLKRKNQTNWRPTLKIMQIMCKTCHFARVRNKSTMWIYVSIRKSIWKLMWFSTRFNWPLSSIDCVGTFITIIPVITYTIRRHSRYSLLHCDLYGEYKDIHLKICECWHANLWRLMVNLCQSHSNVDFIGSHILLLYYRFCMAYGEFCMAYDEFCLAWPLANDLFER